MSWEDIIKIRQNTIMELEKIMGILRVISERDWEDLRIQNQIHEQNITDAMTTIQNLIERQKMYEQKLP